MTTTKTVRKTIIKYKLLFFAVFLFNLCFSQEKKGQETIYVKFDFTGNDKNDSRPIKLAEEPIAVFTRTVEKYGKNKFVCNKSKPMKIKVSQKFLNNIKFTRTYDLKQEKSKNYTINLIEITKNGDIFYYPNVTWGQIEYLE